MSKENRLAAKKRSAQARTKRVIKKVVIVVLCLAVLAVIGLIIWSKIQEKQKETIDYSYVTDNGTLKGVNTSKDVTLPDYTNMGITLADYIPSEEEITLSVNDYVKGVVDTNSAAAEMSEDDDTDDADDIEADADTEDEDAEDEIKIEQINDEASEEDDEDEDDFDVNAILTDEWVEANVATTLSDKYPHTVDGLRAYFKDNLQNDNIENDLMDDIYSYLLENGSASISNSLIDRVQWNLKNQEQGFYSAYSSMFGYATVEEYYKSVGIDFDAETRASAEEELKKQAIALAIFDKEGLSFDKATLKDYYQQNDYDGTSYDDYIASTSENYYYLQAKISKVEEFLKGLVK